MEITKKEEELIRKLLIEYEKENYMSISKEENDWVYELIDKF